MPTTPQRPVGPRARHELLVLDVLRRNGPASRAELVTGTGLSRATISSLAADLLARGSLVELPVHAAAPGRAVTGRPPAQLALDPASGAVLGVDFGHTRVTLVVADAAHEVVGSRVQPYARATGWDRRIAIALDAAAELLQHSGSPPLTAVGAGVPGSLTDRGAVLARITGELGRAFAVPVRPDNNARLAGLAETTWGAARGLRDVAYVRLSHGVGGALVLGGRIHTGPHGTAGEVGHVCVDATGPVCRCSHQGCLEAFVGLDRVLGEAGVTSLLDLRSACDAGEPVATGVVLAAGHRIGGVLAGVGNIVGVTHFVLGGELAALGDHLLTPVRRTLRRQLPDSGQRELRVDLAALGEYAGALGAVASVLVDAVGPDSVLPRRRPELPALVLP